MGLNPLNAILVATSLVLVSLNIGIGMYATGQVPAAVEEAVAMKAKDDICENVMCTEVNEDWKESTSQRDFYAWHITNVDDVNDNYTEPIYERVGPVTYDVTLKKEVDNYDVKNGLLTYKQTTSYACAKETKVPCTTEVSQLNIAFTPQVVGATGTAINTVMETTKTAFVSGVIDIHMKQVSAAYEVADYNEYNIDNLRLTEGDYEGAVVDTSLGNSAESYYLDEMFNLFDEAYGDAFLEDDTKTYLGEGGVTPRWVDGTWNDDGDGILELDEVWGWDQNGDRTGDLNGNNVIDNESSSFISTINLEYAFYEAVGPEGENLSLNNFMGPLVFAAMGEPDSMEEILQNPEDSITLQRAELWGFTHPTDLNITLSRDWTLYGGMGKLMLDYGAGNDDYLTDYSEDGVNLSTRALNLFGIEMDDDVASKVFAMGHETDEPMGIVAVSDSGTSFGLTEFLDMDKQTAIDTYGISGNQHQILKDFCSDWMDDTTTLPLILIGDEGNITASEFVNQTFGSDNPLDEDDPYLEYSLNAGGSWGSGVYGFPSGDPIDISREKSANILYGPWGLTTVEGASMFLYGELSGKSLPINYTNNQSAEAVEWTNQTVADIYGIDIDAGGAVRLLMMEYVFKNIVPEVLIDSFETSRYLTQSVNNWLLGWHDPVNAYLQSGDKDDMTVGWTSLESNETYYGSSAYVEGGISTGNPALITICTGETDTCDKGETVQVGDSEYVGWRTLEKEQATFGLLTAEKQSETTGGFVTGEGDLVDLSGYGAAAIICDEEGTLKGIPVDVCTAEMDPLTRPIQGKLINNGDLLDVIPGALPVYFGSNVQLKVEQISGAIIAGESESTFWLDKRNTTEQQTPPTKDDLQEVFVIKTTGELDDETAETMESQIVTNQDQFAYFTNFDHWIDYVTLGLWISALISLLMGAVMIFKPDNDVGIGEAKWNDEPEEINSELELDDLDDEIEPAESSEDTA